MLHTLYSQRVIITRLSPIWLRREMRHSSLACSEFCMVGPLRGLIGCSSSMPEEAFPHLNKILRAREFKGLISISELRRTITTKDMGRFNSTSISYTLQVLKKPCSSRLPQRYPTIGYGWCVRKLPQHHQRR